jgi:hypothetical protein
MDEFQKISTDILEKDKAVLRLLQEKGHLVDDLIKIKNHDKEGKISFVYKSSQWYYAPFDGGAPLNLSGSDTDYSSVIKEMERVVLKRMSEIEEELSKYLK